MRRYNQLVEEDNDDDDATEIKSVFTMRAVVIAVCHR